MHVCVFILGVEREFTAFIRFSEEFVMPKWIRNAALEPLHSRFERGLRTDLSGPGHTVINGGTSFGARSVTPGPGCLVLFYDDWVLAYV